MPEKEESFVNSKRIVRVYAIFGLLFLVLAVLSPLTIHFSYLGRGIFWLFGLVGYWLLIPALMAVLALVVHDGSFSSPWHFRFFIGFALFLLGAGALWCHVGLKGVEDFSFLTFEEAFESLSFGDYYLFNPVGGGLIGYYLAALLNLGGSVWVYTGSVIIIVSGLIIVFWPLEKKAYRAIRRSMAISASRRSERKAQEEADAKAEEAASLEQENKPLEGVNPPPFEGTLPESDGLSTPSFVPTEDSFVSKAPKMVMDHEEKANGSRLNLYGGDPAMSLPKDLTDENTRNMAPAVEPSSLYHSGLREAVLTLGPASSLTPKAAPSAPSLPKTPLFMEDKPEEPIAEAVASSTPSPVDNAPIIQENPAPIEEKPKEETPITVTNIVPDLTKMEQKPEPETAPISLVPPLPPEETKPTPEEPEEPAAESEAPASEGASLSNMQPKAQNRPPYKFPPLDLLKDYPDTGDKAKLNAECEERKAIINQIFDDFKAGAHVESYTIGPSVTRYNIQVDGGVTVSSVNKYIQNVSVRLGGVATRYEEIVPGQATSGLEIANKVSTIVSLKETIKNLPPLSDKTNLYVPFGENISGKFISSDLSEFPHMLISGSTGSGKSIFMHGLIVSLIMRNRPEDLKLVMVDPKRVEMAAYRDIPHLLCPIIKEPVQAKVAFEKLIQEMERRYSVFEYAGVRDIRSFNNDYAPEAGVEKMPFIVVIVDEFADLADSCKNISELVVRIAQKARAAGIHLVIATQRPSVDVITGTVKANLACRVALSMSSVQDSMTIIGQSGAEELAGHGDMLVDCSHVLRNGFMRCQGCLVDHHELSAITSYIKEQIPVHYNSAFMDLTDHEAQQAAAEESGPSKAEIRSAEGQNLYELIKETVMGREYTSISRIQREFGVGFPRAGKIMAQLQREGIVANEPDTASSSKGCRVLLHKAPNNAGNPGSTDQSAPTSGGLQ